MIPHQNQVEKKCRKKNYGKNFEKNFEQIKSFCTVQQIYHESITNLNNNYNDNNNKEKRKNKIWFKQTNKQKIHIVPIVNRMREKAKEIVIIIIQTQ